jgi:hypothetical protein
MMGSVNKGNNGMISLDSEGKVIVMIPSSQFMMQGRYRDSVCYFVLEKHNQSLSMWMV